MSISLLGRLRRRLPLQAQMGLGWLKYHMQPRPIWDENEFKNYYEWLEKTQWWTREELEEFQLERLRALVKQAYENAPYYRRVFDERKLKPKDIVTLSDLQKLPLLQKEDLRNNLEDLVPRAIDKSSLRYVTTSGSTGKSLGVYWDKDITLLHERAFEYRQWKWAGYRFGDRTMTLRGSSFPKLDKSGKQPWYEYNPAHNELKLSVYEMTEENLFKYIDLIKKFQPKFIYTAPTSIEIMARFMVRNAITLTMVKAIFCESETLYPVQRKLIESRFGCKIYSGYGMTERAADAVECEQHQGYHVNMEYGIFELIDQDNKVIEGSGLSGRVVGTGLDTFYMPLIRYVTDDVAEYSPTTCSCGRGSPLVQDFKGRLREVIFSKSGYAVAFSAVYAIIHGPTLSKVRELKFVQERKGELIAQIVKAHNFSETEVAQEISEELCEKLDKDEFSVQVTFIDHVPRNIRGKIGLLDQRLPVSAEYLGGDFGNQI
jgi:phenylacetate-CoA ligase